jgi:hypothetical protein
MLSSFVSNRFVAEGIAGHTATQRAARELAAAAALMATPVAFIGSHIFRKACTLELIAPRGHRLADAQGYEPGVQPGWIRHLATRVAVRVHESGTPIAGGPTLWPDPVETDNFMGIPVLRLNAFLETELTRALNAPDGREHADNVEAAILTSGATLDRSLELHPYVTETYQELWESVQGRRLWPAVA